MHLQVQIKWNFCCDLISCAWLKILIKIEISLHFTIFKSKNVMSYYRCKFKWGKRPFVVKQRTFSNLHHLLTWQVETHTHNARTFSYNKHEKRDTHTLRTAQTKHAFCLKLMCTLVQSFLILRFVLIEQKQRKIFQK